MVKKILVCTIALFIALMAGCSQVPGDPGNGGATPGNNQPETSHAVSPLPSDSAAPPAVTSQPQDDKPLTINRIIIDGKLDEWRGVKPTAIDPQSDVRNSGVDIQSVFAAVDDKYLYVAATYTGSNPTINIKLDVNDDDFFEYNAECEINQKTVYIYKAVSSPKTDFTEVAEAKTVASDEALEYAIPLADIGNPETNLTIGMWANPENVDDPQDRDDVDGFFSPYFSKTSLADENTFALFTASASTEPGGEPENSNPPSQEEPAEPEQTVPEYLSDITTTSPNVTSYTTRPMVTAGGDHSILVTADGILYAFGNNDYGEIGNGENGDGNYKTIDLIVPEPLRIMDGVQYAIAQNYHSLALKTDGTLWAWGYNGHGQVGNGTYKHQPIPVEVLDNVKFVASGHGLHSLAIRGDNTLWAWGSDEYGELGDGINGYCNKPKQVMSDVVYAASGYNYSMAIKSDGSLWAWGCNSWGNLGDGTKTDRYEPVRIMDDVKMVAAGQTTSYALKNDGTLWAWGRNKDGNIGDGTTTQRLKPVKIMTHVKSLSTTSMQPAAIREDGTLWMWGPAVLCDSSLVPVKVMNNVKYVSSDYSFGFIIKDDNTVWAFGKNEHGQLGTGDTGNAGTPVKINVK